MNITVDESAVKRIEELRSQQGKAALMLRVTVDGGGCSGFQYRLELSDDAPGEKDLTFSDAVVTDDISMTFLKDSTIRFDDALIGSEFKIDNPNAVAGCGCGTSFAV
ncbi:MAG: iron-sulfur cluster assembly accessory protein [Alphaproteobacteria bacterium]|nr:iron-sulfur cluster assembly accessory protein [Alphaproteobacteria bacterium]